MNIEYLHYYLDVAKTKSITQAAKLNFISPQGMSRAMGEFEKELGRDLLIRHSNKLSLSPIGEAIVPKVAATVDAYAELLEAASTISQPHPNESGSLLLDCQYVGMLAFLPNKAKDFIFGSDAIHFRESENSQIRKNVLTHFESADHSASFFIGLLCFFEVERAGERAGVSTLIERGLHYRPYMKSYDVVMINANSPLAAKSTLTDEEIASKPLVTSNSFLRNVISRRFGNDAISFASTDFSLRRNLVARGAVHSFLPAFAQLTMEQSDEYVLRDMEHPYELEIGFIGSDSDFAAASFQALVGILDEFYEAHADSGLYTLHS